MLVLPAIDVRGGQCVRLRQGDYQQETVFGSDPRTWPSAGSEKEPAFSTSWISTGPAGRPINGPSVRAIVAAAGVPCQLGGGLRSQADIKEALGWGVRRVILGTRAFKDPHWLENVCRHFPGQIVLGLDARQGQVATNGWLEVSTRPALEFVRLCGLAVGGPGVHGH